MFPQYIWQYVTLLIQICIKSVICILPSSFLVSHSKYKLQNGFKTVEDIL